MGNSDFKQRLERLNKAAHQQPVEAEVKTIRLAPPSSGVGKYFWGAFGGVWGLIAMGMLVFSFANYDNAFASTQTPQIFVIVVAAGAVGLFSMAIFALLLGMSLLFLPQYQGLRLLVIGFGVGLVIGGVVMGLA